MYDFLENCHPDFILVQFIHQEYCGHLTLRPNVAVIVSRSVRQILLRSSNEAQRATTWHNVPQHGDSEARAWRQRGINPHNVGVIKGVKCHKTWRSIRDTMTVP